MSFLWIFYEYDATLATYFVNLMLTKLNKTFFLLRLFNNFINLLHPGDGVFLLYLFDLSHLFQIIGNITRSFEVIDDDDGYSGL